ncbi:activator protein, partial [Streptomyces sp. SID7803]|nr:activator protein [Streptomyces sp. SID7803]
MRYELLGPLRVSHEGRGGCSLSAPKMEMTLATLLVGAGRVTTKDQIIEELWGGSGGPPRRASAAVHVYLSQLRKFLTA